MPKYFLLICWLLASCTGIRRVEKFKDDLTFANKTISIKNSPTDSLEIYYSGCSGFYFKFNENGLLHDPFLSNNGPMLKISSAKLKIDSALIEKYFEKIVHQKKDSTGIIKALIASHTHYDHVLDFPLIINKHLKTDSTIIGGNHGLGALLELNNLWGEKSNKKVIFNNFEEKLSDYQYFNQWIYVKNKSIRILPILSSHAPHYYGIKLYNGNIEANSHKIPEKAAQFKEGQSLSYIIDFMKGNEPVFRCYIQGSASQFPMGFPPQNIDNKAFDLAILCVASYKYVVGYPEAILEQIKPKHVILAHWENFFLQRKELYQAPAQVPFTNVKMFLKNYKKIAKNLNISDFTMPVANTNMIFKF